MDALVGLGWQGQLAGAFCSVLQPPLETLTDIVPEGILAIHEQFLNVSTIRYFYIFGLLHTACQADPLQPDVPCLIC